MRSPAKYALLALAFASTPLLADNYAAAPLYDVVAVGRGRGEILLATLAAPPHELRWRFRRIAIASPGRVVRNTVLSASGTKMLVVFSDETTSVLDLTERIAEFNLERPQLPQHRLPEQRFPLASGGRVCLLDDAGTPVPNACKAAADAVIAGEGRILYARADGSLMEQPDQSEEQLPYHLPRGARYELLAGQPGDRRNFLVLVTVPSQPRNGETAPSNTEIVDPRRPAEQLGQFADRTVAALRAQLDFAAASATEIGDTALSFLAARLEEQGSESGVAWSFYRIAPNPELYAPVLEFAPGEPDYPSDADIWQEIAPLPSGSSREAYQAAYASMGDRRWSRCTFYFRTLSFPGTWLIEYWFYYPFDEGHPHPHLHDSEHLFVEVDKLGGSVRNFFASDHDSFVPNNLYSTLVKDAEPVTLPLFAMVELGKHAMSPDLNHDGHFTRGVDDNLHVEPYSFWGLRDRGSKFHFFMEPYRRSMSLPRPRDDRFALASAFNVFPAIDVPVDHQVCQLAPFPDDPPCANCAAASAEAAIRHLVDHPDALAPENIYKPYVIPWREIRVGAGAYDWREGRGQFSVALAGDLRHMTGGLLPIPARLALEYIWSPWPLRVPLIAGGQPQFTRSKSTIWAGARIERLVTNTQGFYFGVTPEWADISARILDGALTAADSRFRYTGVSYHAGYLLELPSWHRGNFTNHIGIVFRDASGYPVLFEWRVSVGLLPQRGRHDFGARADDRNPYQ